MDAMQAIGTELLKAPRGDLKFIFNHKGIVFFPAAQQHRDVKINGLSYEHDYRGNAVAGLVMKDRLEVRFHTLDLRIVHVIPDGIMPLQDVDFEGFFVGGQSGIANPIEDRIPSPETSR